MCLSSFEEQGDWGILVFDCQDPQTARIVPSAFKKACAAARQGKNILAILGDHEPGHWILQVLTEAVNASSRVFVYFRRNGRLKRLLEQTMSGPPLEFVDELVDFASKHDLSLPFRGAE